MRFIFGGMMLAYLGGNIYIFIRALQTLSGHSVAIKILFSVLFWLVALAMFIAFGARDAAMPAALMKALYLIGTAWLVFTLYMVLALLLCDIVRLIVPQFRYGFWCALGFTFALLIYGHINYLNPKVINLDITLDKPIAGGPMKIVAISDVHLGEGTGKQQMRKYAEMINAENPDLILIAGDLIDNSVTPLYREQMQEELSMLKAPMGIYSVAGNHEYISGIDRSAQFLTKTPVVLLRDTIVSLPNGVQIIGRDDRSNRHRRKLEDMMIKTNAEYPIIVMDHQPYDLYKSDSLKVDLQLSGHTHRGQVWPASLLTDKMYEQSYGYRKWNHSHIFVSSGLSLWGPPFRIGTNSDMAVINLKGTDAK